MRRRLQPDAHRLLAYCNPRYIVCERPRQVVFAHRILVPDGARQQAYLGRRDRLGRLEVETGMVVPCKAKLKCLSQGVMRCDRRTGVKMVLYVV